jgi:hypothetical protein
MVPSLWAEWDGSFSMSLWERLFAALRWLSLAGAKFCGGRVGSTTSAILGWEQSDIQHVGHVLRYHAAKLAAQRLRDLGQIFFVSIGQDNSLDTRPEGGQRFLL